ncbi:MAG: hypothetical protein J6S14_20950 [Clostridia bacterium]|nr:hypothetical protein [Clostridia bacterium]
MSGLINETDRNAILEDALTAIELLKAIVNECEHAFPHGYYVKDKAERARRRIAYILNNVSEEEE